VRLTKLSAIPTGLRRFMAIAAVAAIGSAVYPVVAGAQPFGCESWAIDCEGPPLPVTDGGPPLACIGPLPPGSTFCPPLPPPWDPPLPPPSPPLLTSFYRGVPGGLPPTTTPVWHP
jgi:hypothetical protein